MNKLASHFYQLFKKYTWLFFCSVVVSGLLLLIITSQNDFHSPLLFIIKALIFPITIVFLITLWLFTILAFKNFSNIFPNNRFIKGFPIIVSVAMSLLFLPTILPNITVSAHFSAEADKSGFKVATFSAMTRSRNGQDIRRFIQEYQPDVLCLQEVTIRDISEFSQLYPYENSHGQSNLRIFSRIPLNESNDSSDSKSVKSSKNSIQAVELNMLDGSKAKVLNVHMPRQYRGDKYFSKVLKAIQLHTETSLPIIFCGDFNMTPHHSLYGYLTRQLGFNDAQQTNRLRYGFTFPNGNRRLAYFGAWIRIDYLFSTGFLNGTTQVINASDLSDHKAVMSRFLLAKD